MNRYAETLRRLSPWQPCEGCEPVDQTLAFLEMLFGACGGRCLFAVHVRGDYPHGKPGVDMRSCVDWHIGLVFNRFRLTGDMIRICPYSGRQGVTKKGRPSYMAAKCVASCPFVAVTLDGAAWCDILQLPLARKVAAVVSDGDGLHGLVHIGGDALEEFDKGKAMLAKAWAVRIDATPYAPFPLPGVHRADNGELQDLIYLNAEAVRPKAAKPATQPATQDKPQNPPSARSVPQVRNIAPEAHGRATEAANGLSAHVSTDRLLADAGAFNLSPDEDLDAVLADEEVRETCEAAGVCPARGFPDRKKEIPKGRHPAKLIPNHF